MADGDIVLEITSGDATKITGTENADVLENSITTGFPIYLYVHNVIYGGAGNDQITSTMTSVLAPLEGALDGAITSAFLASSTFDAWLYGEDGNDTLIGDDARTDHLDGGTGDDTISGGGGNDFLVDSGGRNLLDGGDGDDTLTLSGNQAGTQISGIENLQLTGWVAIDLDLLNSFSSVSFTGDTDWSDSYSITLNQAGTLTARLSDTANVEITLGVGDNVIDLSYSQASIGIVSYDYDNEGKQVIKTGSGNDSIDIGDSSIALDISTGSGDDIIELDSNDIYWDSDADEWGARSGTLNGGSGNDTLWWSGGSLRKFIVTDIEVLQLYQDLYVSGTADVLNSFGKITSNAAAITIELSGSGDVALKLALGLAGDVYGSDGADAIDVSSATGRWTIHGGAGADVIVGGHKNDRIDGESGRDTVEVDGVQSNYDIVENLDGSWTVTDKRTGAANQGVDTLINVEKLKFSDGTIIAVSPNTDPTLAHQLEDQRVNENESIFFQIGDDAFTDAEDTLSYSATLANGDELPSWLKFDSETLTFEGTPPSSSDHIISIKVTASDGGASVSDVFDLLVNHAPTGIKLSGNTVNENVKAGTVIGTLTVEDADAGDSFDFYLSENPGNAFAIVDGKLVVASGAKIDYEARQTYSITVQATDEGWLDHEETFSIKVADVIDRVTGNQSANTLKGAAGADIIKGLGGNDALYGLAGADRLEGGKGVDKLYGGTGTDQFAFATGDSGKTRKLADTIFDFTKTDSIDLTAWDANSKAAGLQDFTYIGSRAFGGHAGELHFIKEKSDTWIEGDTNGDRKADFIVHLDDAVTLKADYFDL